MSQSGRPNMAPVSPPKQQASAVDVALPAAVSAIMTLTTTPCDEKCLTASSTFVTGRLTSEPPCGVEAGPLNPCHTEADPKSHCSTSSIAQTSQPVPLASPETILTNNSLRANHVDSSTASSQSKINCSLRANHVDSSTASSQSKINCSPRANHVDSSTASSQSKINCSPRANHVDSSTASSQSKTSNSPRANHVDFSTASTQSKTNSSPRAANHKNTSPRSSNHVNTSPRGKQADRQRPLKGILSTGSTLKKRVSFRDSKLVSIREIPPRSYYPSSSEENESDDENNDDNDDDDDDDDSDSSDTDDDSDDDSDTDEDDDEDDEDEEEDGKRRQAGVLSTRSAKLYRKHKPLTVAPSSRSPPLPSSPGQAASPKSYPSPTVTVAKGSYSFSSTSSGSKAIALVSQITGVSSVATQALIKQRHLPVSSIPSPTSSPASAAEASLRPPGHNKKVTAVLRVEKKVNKVCPNLDGVEKSQTARAAQKQACRTEPSAHKGTCSKTGRKKRVLHSLRKQDGGGDRRRCWPKKGKDYRQAKSKTNGAGALAGPGNEGNNRLEQSRDSLTLPRLSSEEHVLLQLAKHSQRRTPHKTPIFSRDGFMFLGDPTKDVNGAGKAAGPPLTSSSPSQQPKERPPSAPPSSPRRRKRYYAWHMANGNLDRGVHDSPSITPMWETVTPVSTLTTSSPTAVANFL